MWEAKSHFNGYWIKRISNQKRKKEKKTDSKLLLRIRPNISFLLEINNLHLTMAIFFIGSVDSTQKKFCSYQREIYNICHHFVCVMWSFEALSPGGKARILTPPKTVFFRWFSLLFSSPLREAGYLCYSDQLFIKLHLLQLQLQFTQWAFWTELN